MLGSGPFVQVITVILLYYTMTHSIVILIDGIGSTPQLYERAEGERVQSLLMYFRLFCFQSNLWYSTTFYENISVLFYSAEREES